jgi:hypothetical protein
MENAQRIIGLVLKAVALGTAGLYAGANLTLQLGQPQYRAARASLAGVARSRALRGWDLFVGLRSRTHTNERKEL